ncbi:MAG: hypothetical protein V3S04_00750 [Candidatus Omnitrophota bacterium]
MNCVYHPEAEASCKCLLCAAPICENCKVQMKHESYCKKCIVNKLEGAKKGDHSPMLATILSFVIGGAGQMYNGEIGKGILIFFTSWLVIPWVYGIFNAYSTAKKIREGTLTPKRQSGCLAASVIIVALMFLMIPILGLMAAVAIPNFVKARQAALNRRGLGGSIKIDLKKLKIEAESAAGIAPKEKAREKLGGIISFKKREIYKVYLKNGHIFEAEIGKETPDMYIFKIDNATFEILKLDIERMRLLK